MESFFIVILLLFVFIFKLTKYNTKETFYEPRNHMIGPSINGLKASDDQFQIDFAQNIDPFKLNIKNNNLLLTSYQNNNHNTLNDYNVRESIIYSSIKEILNETKTKLNNNNTPPTINTNSLNNSNVNVESDAFNPIINTIFNSINAMANNAVYIKPVRIVDNTIVFNKNKSVYIIDYIFDIDVLHPLDALYTKNNDIKNAIQKNELPLQIIVKFSVNNDPQQINYSNIYINDLSVIIKN